VLRYMLLIARSVEVFTKWRRALDVFVAIIRVSISWRRRSSSQAVARRLLVRRLMVEGGVPTDDHGSPCVGGSGRCRLHGGRSTGPQSAAALDALKAKMTKHGWFVQEAVAGHARSNVSSCERSRPRQKRWPIDEYGAGLRVTSESTLRRSRPCALYAG